MALGPASSGEAVQITVRDTGPGLRQTNAEQLFNIFTSTKDSGLGLGLAISREIVESHGGHLWAEPAPSEGACLHFTLPTVNEGDS
jgi:two-component system sensor kinase FixL